MAFADIALWFSIAPMLVGTIFMVSAPKQVTEGFYNLDVLKGKGLSSEVGGLICHVFFMLGSLAWEWGCVNLCLALGLDPVLAVTPSATSLFCLIAFMFITGNGITGVPGLSGPPIPARVILGTVGLLVNTNLVMTVMAGGVPISFWVVYVLAIAWPQALGLKIRNAGWMTVAIIP